MEGPWPEFVSLLFKTSLIDCIRYLDFLQQILQQLLAGQVLPFHCISQPAVLLMQCRPANKQVLLSTSDFSIEIEILGLTVVDQQCRLIMQGPAKQRMCFQDGGYSACTKNRGALSN